MVRELANHWPPNYADVFRWPLREALLSYVVKMRAAARREYEHSILVWSAIAPHNSKKIDPPKIPPILRGRD